MIDVMDNLSIPETELTFRASRSGGPGGQNVNKVNTRVTLRFNVATSPSLSQMQKQHLMTAFPSRINQEGVLHVVSQRHRSQAANRQAAVSHFAALLRDALTPELPRQLTTKPRVADHHRRETKKHRSRVKQQRRRPLVGDS